MRWIQKIAVVLSLCAALLLPVAAAETYTLKDGSSVTGDVNKSSFNQDGVMVKQADGTFSKRVPWKNLTQDSIRKLTDNPLAAPYVEALVEWTPEERVKEKTEAYNIPIKPVTKLDRPAKPSSRLTVLFKSPVTLVLLALFYLGNIWIGYELAIFKNRPAALVCGVAAVVPLLGNVIFAAVPPARIKTQEELDAEAAAASGIEPGPDVAPTIANPKAEERAAKAAAEAEAKAAAAAAAGAAGEPSVSYLRGQFTFNRRFFESKLAPFCHAVLAPEDADKDVVMITLRGDFVGHHIARLGPNELFLQVRKGDVSEEVMIPYNEVREIHIKPRPLA